MSKFACVTTPKQQLKVETERIKALRVIGKAVGQVVVENSIPINAIKIDRIDAEIKDVVDHIFKDKIVKQGFIHKQVFYVDPRNVVRHIAEDIPFMLTVDIKGVCPEKGTIEVQNHLLDIDTDFILTPKHGRKKEVNEMDPYGDYEEPCAILQQKVVAHILVKASEWTQIDVVTDIDLFPKINSSCRIDFKNKCF